MTFSDDWNDQLLARARHELEIVQVEEQYWRKARKQASIAALIVVPLLAALLAGSFVYLTRTQVSGVASVLIVGALGGLLGGVSFCLRRLAARVERRIHPTDWPDWGIWSMLVVPLAGGAGAGAFAALALTRYGSDGPYRPQTLYVAALACALVLARLLNSTLVTIGEEPL